MATGSYSSASPWGLLSVLVIHRILVKPPSFLLASSIMCLTFSRTKLFCMGLETRDAMKRIPPDAVDTNAFSNMVTQKQKE